MENSALNGRSGVFLTYAVKVLLLAGLLAVRPIMADDAGVCQLKAQQELALYGCMRELDRADAAMPDVTENPRLAENLESAAGRWVKIVVNNSNETSEPRLLALGIPDAYFSYLFKSREGRLQTLLSQDRSSTFAERPVPNRFLYAEVELAALGTEIFYVYYRTHGKTPLQPRLLTAKKLAQQDTQSDVLNGMILGGLTMLVAVLFFSQQGMRHVDSRNYAILIAFNLLFLSQTQGYNFQFLWPEQGVWNMQAPGVISIGVLIAHATFCIGFLQMRQRFRHLYYVFIGLVVLAVAGVPFAADDAFAEWASALCVVYAVVAIAAGILAVRRRVPAAPLYLLGTISLFIFNVVLMLMSIFWRNPFPDISFFTYPKIAYMLEPAFFIIAVVKQLQRLNEQKAELRVKRQAETELLIKAEQERLAAVASAKNQQLLLASASHDLTQPLASIRFATDALRSIEEHSPLAQHINTTLDYAQSLIQSLIRQARQDSNPADGIVLFELFDQLQNEFATPASKKGLRLSHVSSNIELQGSALLLHRILGNLLANAIRYSDKGRVVFGVRRRQRHIEIQVLDTGIGLPEADCRALTAPFRQGQHGDSAGYGLGLFIVKTLCDQCGYELWVSSVLGKGSVFAIQIPIADD
ncbi:MAG: sensor histidine kinase [Methylobacter sp.]